jgi:hypothetical protein
MNSEKSPMFGIAVLTTLASGNVLGGAVPGPSAHIDRVNAYSTDVYDIVFEAWKDAVIYIEGDGDTDLDLYVYDQYGNEVCSDTDYSDIMYCAWMPTSTARYRLRIENLGGVWNEYNLRTN